MKKVLSIADSIANTRYSASRCVETFNDYKVEPLLAVPEFTEGDNVEKTDIGETLDYCFEEETPAAISIGMIRDAAAVKVVASKIAAHEHGAVVADPYVISPEGKLLVQRETFDEVRKSLLSQIQFLSINIYEAELFSGIECKVSADVALAARSICERHNCVVFVAASSKTMGRDLLAIGGKVEWFDSAVNYGSDSGKSFISAVVCELTSDKSIVEAVEAARDYCGVVEVHKEPEHVAAPVQSLVSPAKSIRDAARTMPPPDRITVEGGLFLPRNGVLARELAKQDALKPDTAVMSVIEDESADEKESSDSAEEARLKKIL